MMRTAVTAICLAATLLCAASCQRGGSHSADAGKHAAELTVIFEVPADRVVSIGELGWTEVDPDWRGFSQPVRILENSSIATGLPNSGAGMSFVMKSGDETLDFVAMAGLGNHRLRLTSAVTSTVLADVLVVATDSNSGYAQVRRVRLRPGDDVVVEFPTFGSAPSVPLVPLPGPPD